MESRRRGPYGRLYIEQESGLQISDYDEILCDDSCDVLQYNEFERLHSKKAKTDGEGSSAITSSVVYDGSPAILIGGVEHFEEYVQVKDNVS
jgi:hypothetical protein